MVPRAIVESDSANVHRTICAATLSRACESLDPNIRQRLLSESFGTGTDPERQQSVGFGCLTGLLGGAPSVRFPLLRPCRLLLGVGERTFRRWRAVLDRLRLP
jgi:hypothetical protein